MLASQHAEIMVPAPRIVQARAAGHHIWQLALGWVLLLPMLYISANGILIPRTGDDIAYEATGGGADTSPVHKISVALVCLLWTALIVSYWPEVVASSRRMKVMIAFPVLAVLSSAWSGEPSQSIVSGVALLIFTMFGIYLSSRFSFQDQVELIMFVGAFALPVSIALALFVPTIGMGEGGGTDDVLGWRGIFGHKQNCAAVCTLWMITALHWKCSGFAQKIFRVVYILMCIALIIFSQSRTGWVLSVVALLIASVIWIFQKMPNRQVVTILAIGIPVLIAAIYGIGMYSAEILDALGKDPTLDQRTIIWAAVWDAVLQHPILGYGFAVFWRGLFGPSQDVVLIVGWALAQAQNGFLDVWLGVGIGGVALIAAMIAQAARNAVRCFQLDGHESHVRWCIVLIIWCLLYNVGETSIGLLNMPWFLFLMACMGLTQVARQTETAPA